MITQADIREHWDFVKPALETLCARMHTGWRPEDVYADCKHGLAWLYLGEEDDAFMVVREWSNRHTLEKALYVWVMCAYKGEDRIDKYMPDLTALAKQYGYPKVKIESPRHGWRRKEGWKEDVTIYIHEVT